MWWDAESTDYVRSRSRRYPGGLDLEPDWATEVLQDPDLVAFEPDPKDSSLNKHVYSRFG